VRAKKVFFLFIVILYGFQYNAFGQGVTNWDWWCGNVGRSSPCNHDDWVNFIDFSPGGMGPNALPVPEVKKGILNNQQSLEFGAQAHFGDGDKTQNLWTNLNVNLAKNVASLVIYANPQEHFNISDKTRDERHLSGEYYEPRGYAKGDIYFGMEIQLTRNRPKGPDLLLRLMTKSATGSEVGGARNTDSPGYFFDLSAGKDFALGKSNLKLRPFAMLGFYSWQTYDDIHPQNDAPLYGAGFDFGGNKNVFTTSVGGYAGWKNNGDKPLVCNIEYLRKGKNLDLLAQFQQGNKDYNYTSFKISAIYHMDIVWKANK